MPTPSSFDRDHPRWPEGAPLGLGGQFRPTGIHPSALRVFIGAAIVLERWAVREGRSTQIALKERFRRINNVLGDSGFEDRWDNTLTNDTARMRRILSNNLRASIGGTRLPAIGRRRALGVSAQAGQSNRVDEIVNDTPQATGALGDRLQGPGTGGEVFDGTQTLRIGDQLGARPTEIELATSSGSGSQRIPGAPETSPPMRFVGTSPSGRLRFASDGGRPTGSGQRRSARTQAYVSTSRVLQGRPIIRAGSTPTPAPPTRFTNLTSNQLTDRLQAARTAGRTDDEVVRELTRRGVDVSSIPYPSPPASEPTDHDGRQIMIGNTVRAAGSSSNPQVTVTGFSGYQNQIVETSDGATHHSGRLVVVPTEEVNPPSSSTRRSPARSPSGRIRNIRSMTRTNLTDLATAMNAHTYDTEAVDRVNAVVRRRVTEPFRDGSLLTQAEADRLYILPNTRGGDTPSGPGRAARARTRFEENQRVWINPGSNSASPWPARVTGPPRIDNLGRTRVPIREVFTPANEGRAGAIEGRDRTIAIESVSPRLHAFDSERQSQAHPAATPSDDVAGLAVPHRLDPAPAPINGPPIVQGTRLRTNWRVGDRVWVTGGADQAPWPARITAVTPTDVDIVEIFSDLNGDPTGEDRVESTNIRTAMLDYIVPRNMQMPTEGRSTASPSNASGTAAGDTRIVDIRERIRNGQTPSTASTASPDNPQMDGRGEPDTPSPFNVGDTVRFTRSDGSHEDYTVAEADLDIDGDLVVRDSGGSVLWIPGRWNTGTITRTSAVGGTNQNGPIVFGRGTPGAQHPFNDGDRVEFRGNNGDVHTYIVAGEEYDGDGDIPLTTAITDSTTWYPLETGPGTLAPLNIQPSSTPSQPASTNFRPNGDASFAPHTWPRNSQELAENIVARFMDSDSSALRPGETLAVRTPPSGRYSRIVRIRNGREETFAHIRHRDTGGRTQLNHQISFVHGSDQILGSALRPGHFRNRPHGAAHRRLPADHEGERDAAIVLNNALASATRRTAPTTNGPTGDGRQGYDARRGQVPLEGMMARTHRRPGGWGAEPSGDMLPVRDGEERAFGIEIEMTGLTFGNARAALSAEGLPVDERDAYSTKNFAAWCACQDGSLGYGDPEIKLPPLSGAAGMELMRRTVRALRAAGGRAGRQRTHGLHVHIDARDVPTDKRYELAETYANNRDLINTIVAPNRNAGAGQYASEGYSTGHGGRELALNIGSPTIEFRRFGSNLVADDIEGWAVLMRSIVNYQKHHDGALPAQSSLLALMQALDVPLDAQEKILARVQRITPNEQNEA